MQADRQRFGGLALGAARAPADRRGRRVILGQPAPEWRQAAGWCSARAEPGSRRSEGPGWAAAVTPGRLVPGLAQASAVTRAEELLAGQRAGQVVADRGYDGDALRETIKAQGAEPVIPGRKNRTVAVKYDKHCYGSRHVSENFFCRIKDQRRVATRYEKTAQRFAAMVMLSCILVWLQL